MENKSSPLFSLPLILFLVLGISLIFSRSLYFAHKSGGIEHDSGWYLGLALNLAKRGIYASFSNQVIKDEDKPGLYPDLYDQVELQDAQGFIHYPYMVSVGPGYVLPQALLLKLFGEGPWVYRLYPLLTFLGLLLLIPLVMGNFLNLPSLLLIFLWLWAVPQATLGFSFEAHSEHIATFYFFFSLLFLLRWRFPFMAGVFFSLSAMTKLIMMILVPCFFLLMAADFLAFTREKKGKGPLWARWGIFLLGTLFPWALFEIYKGWDILDRFGPEGYEYQVRSLKNFILERLNPKFRPVGNPFTFSFFKKKLDLWNDVGIRWPGVMWLAFFLSGPFLYFRSGPGDRKTLPLALYTSGCLFMGFHLFFSKDGWFRLVWPGAFVAMILVCMAWGELLKIPKKRILVAVIFLLTFVPIDRNKLTFPFVIGPKRLEKINEGRYNKHMILGLPAPSLYPLKEQREVVDFLKGILGKEDRIYYRDIFLVAELAPLLDRVFYSHLRYQDRKKKGYSSREKSFLVHGPNTWGPLSYFGDEYIYSGTTLLLCRKTIFVNSSYFVCQME